MAPIDPRPQLTAIGDLVSVEKCRAAHKPCTRKDQGDKAVLIDVLQGGEMERSRLEERGDGPNHDGIGTAAELGQHEVVVFAAAFRRNDVVDRDQSR